MSTLFKNKYRIESTRLPDYDYSSAGAYFITICTKNKEHFFGEIIDCKLQETYLAKICLAVWLDLPNHYYNCILDEFVIMPNHVHMIIIICDNEYMESRFADVAITGVTDTAGAMGTVETGFKPVSTTTTTVTTVATINANTNIFKKRHSVSEIVRGFKTFTARQINQYQNTAGVPFWQSRFHDRIIRDESELNRKRQYIIENPAKWWRDRNNKENLYM